MTATKNKDKHKDVSYSSVDENTTSKFPKIAIVIIIAEFCERFSFSGMKAFLTLYLKSKLMYTDEEATEIYHTFGTLVYFFPVFGAIIADNYIGKYRTIFYLMFVYASGNFLVALTAIPTLEIPARLCTMIGLVLITVGTGGIKPCVAAFGGEQFKESQKKHLSLYFMIMYFTICSAALIAKSVSPLLKTEIQCFGDKDCYSVAFGLPGLIMLSSIVIFVGAKKFYFIKEPSGNVVFDVLRCIIYGLQKKFRQRSDSKKLSHWLDSTSDRFDLNLIADVKKTLLVLMLFIPQPAYWALLDQMGSRWTLQASKMDGDFKFLTIQPDQMQVIAPTIIILMIPLFQRIIYPFLNGFNILKNPLHKMTVGAILTALAFVCSASLEFHLMKTYPVLPVQGESQLRIFNAMSHNITLSASHTRDDIRPMTLFTNKHITVDKTQNITLLTENMPKNSSKAFNIVLMENHAHSIFVDHDTMISYFDSVRKSRSGLPLLRILKSESVNTTTIRLWNSKRNTNEIEEPIYGRVSKLYEIMPEELTLYVGEVKLNNTFHLRMGGVYTIVITQSGDEIVTKLFAITEPNDVSMVFLLPQYILIATGEVLFAATGYEFVFKESPESMRAVIQASWLLTEAAGNIIIILVTRIAVQYNQAIQSFIYTGIMTAAIILFIVIGRKYERCIAKLKSDDVVCVETKNSESQILSHVD